MTTSTAESTPTPEPSAPPTPGPHTKDAHPHWTARRKHLAIAAPIATGGVLTMGETFGPAGVFGSLGAIVVGLLGWAMWSARKRRAEREKGKGGGKGSKKRKKREREARARKEGGPWRTPGRPRSGGGGPVQRAVSALRRATGRSGGRATGASGSSGNGSGRGAGVRSKLGGVMRRATGRGTGGGRVSLVKPGKPSGKAGGFASRMRGLTGRVRGAAGGSRRNGSTSTGSGRPGSARGHGVASRMRKRIGGAVGGAVGGARRKAGAAVGQHRRPSPNSPAGGGQVPRKRKPSAIGRRARRFGNAVRKEWSTGRGRSSTGTAPGTPPGKPLKPGAKPVVRKPGTPGSPGTPRSPRKPLIPGGKPLTPGGPPTPSRRTTPQRPRRWRWWPRPQWPPAVPPKAPLIPGAKPLPARKAAARSFDARPATTLTPSSTPGSRSGDSRPLAPVIPLFGKKRTMPNPYGPAIDALGGTITPENARRVMDYVYGLPGLIEAASKRLTRDGQVCIEEFPLHADAGQMAVSLGAQMARMHPYVEEFRQVFHHVHEADIRRLEEPRHNEARWDASLNRE